MSRDDLIPRNEAAELAVLGGALWDPAGAAEAIEMLSPSDFYVPKHEVVFEAISALQARTEPTDAIAVSDELKRRGDLGRVGGPAFVHQLTDGVVSAAAVGFHAEIVREQAILRRLMLAGDAIAQRAIEGVGETDAIVENARALIDGVSPRTVRSTHWIGESIPQLLREIEAGDVQVTPTGWDPVDRFIGGLRPGAFYVVGARPGVGKTVVALNLATQVARGGATVGYASLEMGEGELQKRLLAAEGTVHLSGLLDGKLGAQDWERTRLAEQAVAGMRLAVIDDAATLARVLSFARTLHRQGGLGLLVVDYLQLLVGDGRAESRQVEVSQFSRALKMLARELQIPVVALSQLNRDSTGRKGGEPRISDLRESGSLEQDADVVLLLHRDEEHSPSKLKVIVAKNRHGRTAEASLAFEGQFARVVTMPWSPTALLNERDIQNG